MNFGIETAAPEQRRPKPADENSLGFGRMYSDHMFTMRWTSDGGWAGPTISPFANLDLSPASLVLDYGQSIFEGLKAYRKAQLVIRMRHLVMAAARQARSLAPGARPTRWNQLR